MTSRSSENPPRPIAVRSARGVDPHVPRPSRRTARTWLTQSLLPWAFSLGLHGLLVMAAVFAIWTGVSSESRQQIVPLLQLGATAGAPLEMRQETSLRPPSVLPQPQVEPTAPPSTLDAPLEIAAPLLGTLDMAGKPSPFQSTLTSSAEFQTTFLGSGGNARRLAFVIDASGSLLDTLPFVLQELQKTVDALHPRQEFTVIFYQGNAVIEAPPAGLKQATSVSKQQLAAWLDPQKRNVLPGGSSDPIPAIRQALSYEPQLIFLLSDNITGGDLYQIEQRRLLDGISQANSSGTRINTLQFLYKDAATAPGQKGTMQLIAENSGGVYRFIGSEDLGLEEVREP